MANSIRALIIKRKKNSNLLSVEDSVFFDTIENLYKLLECDRIDIQERYINGKIYDFIFDDEYLINGKSQEPRNAIAMGIYKGDIQEIIFYSLIICGNANDKGEETALNDEDIKNILSSVKIAETNTGDKLQIIAYDFEEKPTEKGQPNNDK